MAIPTVSTAYNALAHGALNWDTQLRADISGFVAAINGLEGLDSGISYDTTRTDFGGGWSSRVRTAGNQVTLQLGVNPGSNGFGVGSIIGTIPAGTAPFLLRPIGNVMFPVFQRNADGSFGGIGWVSITAATGVLKIEALTTTTMATGSALFGGAAWPTNI